MTSKDIIGIISSKTDDKYKIEHHERSTIVMSGIGDYLEDIQLKGSAATLLSLCVAALGKIMEDNGISENDVKNLLDKLVLDICKLKNESEIRN